MIRTYAVLLSLFFSTVALAQDWERVGLLGDDAIRSTCVNPQGHIFVATQTLHRSTDGGTTWKQIARGIQLQRNNYGPYLYSNTDGTVFILTPDTLYRSSDNGDSWQPIRRGSMNGSMFAVTPSGNLLQSLDSIYVSSDNGTTWRSIRPGGGSVAADHDGVIYAGLYRSTDMGGSWSKIINGLPGIAEIKSYEQGKVYANTGSALYVSTDKGRVWTPFYQAPTTITGFVLYNKDIIVVGTTSVGVQTTTDGGATWYTDAKHGSVIAPGKDLFQNGNEIYVCLDRNIYRSSITWPRVWSEVYVPSGIVRFTRVNREKDIFAVTEYRETPHEFVEQKWWSYDGSRWNLRVEFSHINYRSELQAAELDSNDVLLGVLNGSFVRSTDGGATWKFGIHFDGSSFQLAINKQFIYVASDKQGVYRSSDNGETWDLVNEQGVTAIAAGSDGLAYTAKPMQYFRTADSGWTWQEQVFPFILGSGDVCALECYGASVILGADRTGVYFSSDFGMTFVNYSEGLPADTINEVVATPGGAVFAATTTGIFEFDPSAKTWKSAADQIQCQATSLALGPDGKVYIGTDGDGVWRTTKTYGAWVQNVKSEASASDHISIFPNPASTKIKIEFASMPQTYSVTIFDLLGQSILTTKNTDVVDVSTLRSGQYFVRIATPEHTITLPLLISR